MKFKKIDNWRFPFWFIYINHLNTSFKIKIHIDNAHPYKKKSLISKINTFLAWKLIYNDTYPSLPNANKIMLVSVKKKTGCRYFHYIGNWNGFRLHKHRWKLKYFIKAKSTQSSSGNWNRCLLEIDHIVVFQWM